MIASSLRKNFNKTTITGIRFFSSSGSYSDLKLENCKFEVKEGGVGLVTMDRPKSLNALCDALFKDLNIIMTKFDQDEEIGAIVLTGSKKAFAAGADIKEMNEKEFPWTYRTDMLSWWENIAKIRTPTIAAVNGYALGGGCELAMMCDILLAGDRAMFGQPEIKLGTIPGMGGSQRFTRAIGKSRAMELILTGDFMAAEEACSRGLASRIVPADELVDDAVKTAQKIAGMSKPIAMMAKEAVNASFETTLETGLRYERRIFHSTFGTKDQKEGMSAFANKKDPQWRND
jgi:enoyl-CoA hydratase/carnithine racemase